ncbi:hypothetical protein [Rhizomonospora bruguierae]|uniref:hypothetical protein n=1 Tax=Rhizomonospora bruguierae TaxID=1581705 RepID=UPI001BCE4E9C|nr:hypothetical protein [Micromonospora sp. NBRC 107566]
MASYPALPGGRHLVGGEAQVGHPFQQRHSAVRQQRPVAVGEPVQRVTPGGQLLDPFGELPLDVGDSVGEPCRVGVDQASDLGQRHARPGKGPDLHQP